MAISSIHALPFGSEDGSGSRCYSTADPQFSPSVAWKLCEPKRAVSQAQSSSCERSSILEHQRPSSLFSVLDLEWQSKLLRQTHFYLTRDTNRFPTWTAEPTLLRAKEDSYNGVIIDPSSLPANAETFLSSLRASLLHWKSQKKRGIWLQLSSQLADFVPLAIKEGFQYHHAEPSHVMMTFWIPDTPSTLPPNASHQVGIGAFVMNDRREVLAVQEKDGPLRGSGVWKMPTGLINQAEDLCAGAVREVKEETGIDTEFLQVVGFRHGHFVSFDKSDLYFMCTLHPLSLDVVEQKGEIEAAKWMPLEEFRSQAFFTEHEARRNMLELCVASCDGHYMGFKAHQLQSSSLARPTQYFFHTQAS